VTARAKRAKRPAAAVVRSHRDDFEAARLRCISLADRYPRGRSAFMSSAREYAAIVEALDGVLVELEPAAGAA
jgi:hypothetical protein